MAVVTTNLIQGPGTLYSGAVGATEPADTAVATAPDSGTWTDLGGTTDGLNLSITQEYTELAVDQIVDVPERRMTKREFTVSTNLAEATLDNLALALNDEVTAGSGGTGATSYASLTAVNTDAAAAPTYKALIVDGLAPSGQRRRFVGRRMLQVGAVAFAYKKDTQTVFTVSFAGHYVSSVIAPFKVVDEDAA